MFFYDSTRFRRRSKNLQQPVVCRCLSLIKSLKHLFCFFQEHKYMQTQQQQQRHWSPTFLFYRLSKRAFFFLAILLAGIREQLNNLTQRLKAFYYATYRPRSYVRISQQWRIIFYNFKHCTTFFFSFFFIILLLLYFNSFVRAMS